MLVKFNVVERKNLLDKTVAPKFYLDIEVFLGSDWQKIQ